MRKCILVLADDDPDDCEFVREAFDECGFEGEFRSVEDGEKLLDYLKRRGDFEGEEACPLPDLILLDLNMPRVDGYEALREIKEDERLRRIPVVVLSTSDSIEDIERTYDCGVNSFITKPSGYDELLSVAKGLKSYWLEMVRLPENAL